MCYRVDLLVVYFSLLIGAPKGESGQTDTVNAGAIYSCPLTNVQSNSSARSDQWCQRENVEYSSPDKYNGL
jgi:hypothetical protein